MNKGTKVTLAVVGGLVVVTGIGFGLTVAPFENPVNDAMAQAAMEPYKGRDVTGSTNLVFFDKANDQFGDYTRTFVSPTTITLDDGNVPSDEEKAAIEAAVKFTTLEAIDSVAFDNPSRLDEWKTTVAPQYLDPDQLSALLNGISPNDGQIPNGLIFVNSAQEIPQLLRDGGVRVADKRIGHITCTSNERGGYDVSIYGTALLYFNDEVGAPWYSVMSYNTTNAGQMFNSDGTVMTPSEQEAYLKSMGAATNPIFSDGKDNAMLFTFTGDYSLKNVDGKWLISNAGGTYNVQSAMTQSGNGQMGFRKNVVKK